MKNSKPTAKTYVPAIILVVALLSLGIFALVHGQHSSLGVRTTPLPVTSNSADEASSNNPSAGDSAKSQISSSTSQNTAPSPSSTKPVTSPAAGTLAVEFKDFSMSATNGTAYVTSELTGTKTGSCNLSLTSPTGATQTAAGTVGTSGTYYFCQMNSITGITTPGTWSASLSVSDNGATSKSVPASFTVGQ